MFRALGLVALLTLAASACDDGATVASADLAAPVDGLEIAADLASLRDLASAEMCTPATHAFDLTVDTAGFCAGTTLAGTCVQTFFARIAACFVRAGCCQVGPSAMHRSVAWESGAAYTNQVGIGPWQYSMAGTSCGGGYTSVQTDYWTGPDGSKLTYTTPSGAVTCPDGSAINVGNLGGQCAELDDLLQPWHPLQCSPACCVTPPPA
jgi:hypothetical protein